MSDLSSNEALITQLNNYIDLLIKPLLSDVDHSKILIDNKQSEIVVSLIVNQEDVSRLIGRHGQAVSALEDMLYYNGVKRQKRIKLKILPKEKDLS